MFNSPKFVVSGPGGAPDFTVPPPPTHCLLSNRTIYYQNYYEVKRVDPQHPFGVSRKCSTDSATSGATRRRNSEMSYVSSISNLSNDINEEDQVAFVQPDGEVCQRIVQQVELLFSNENIMKDKFLLKHVKRNKDGFVSLKLISSLKKVKQIVKDWRQVRFAIENLSLKLEINDAKTKVRRVDPIPDEDETEDASRTILALNIPVEPPTIESVAEFFSPCGDVAFIRILKPGSSLPPEVRKLSPQFPELTSNTSALIEFEKSEFALKAKEQFTSNYVDSIWVIDLDSPAEKHKEKIDENKMALCNQEKIPIPTPSANIARRKLGVYAAPEFFSIPKEQQKFMNLIGKSAPPMSCLSLRRSSRSSIGSNPRNLLSTSPNPNDQTSIYAWMNRRASGQLDIAKSTMFRQQLVLRQPRGPEDCQGFARRAELRLENQKKFENASENCLV